MTQLESEPAVSWGVGEHKNIPFNIPKKWAWARLGELAEYGYGRQIGGSQITHSMWVLDLEDIEKNSGRILRKKYGTETTSSKTCFKKGDVLYGKLRPYLNKVLVADEDGCCTTEIIPISVSSAKSKIDAEFLCYFLRSPYFVEYANNCSYGVKMPRLGTKDAKSAWIAIPPLDEQQRIVAKINKLFNQIDRAERAYSELSGPLSERFRQLCLEKAIQGKLVPQLENEPEVTQIGETPEDIPFVIPEKWKWVRLDRLSSIVRGGSPRPIKNFITNAEDGINWIKIGDAERGSPRICRCAERIKPEGIRKSRFVKKGSLLLTNSMSFGFPYILDVDGCIHDGWLAFSDFESYALRNYLYYVFLSPYCKKMFVDKAAGAVVKNLNIDKVKSIWIPLPPLEEQRRIVAKLTELLNVTRQLENSASMS